MTTTSLTEYASQFGLDITDPQFDAEVHRFNVGGKKNVGWYIGFQNYSQTDGAAFYVAQLGNWTTGDIFQWCSLDGKKISKQDHILVQEQMKAAKAKAATQKKQRQTKASHIAEKLLQNPAVKDADPKHPYLTKKKIEPCGAKQNNMDLIIPMRDDKGKLVGAQRIDAEGNKLFLPGQQTKGAWFEIAAKTEDNQDIYICEGYATGCSVHQATGGRVLVAFNSGNLPEVARLTRLAEPDATIVICADNDAKTEATTGKNPGLVAGRNAAELGLATMAYPTLESDEGTDFNDLHAAQGLQAVAEALAPNQSLETEGQQLGFKALGTDPSNTDWWVASGRLMSMRTYNLELMLKLAPLSYWESNFPGQRGGVRWEAVKDHLTQRSLAAGDFDPKILRGSGVWLEDGSPVVNTGCKTYGKPGKFRYIKSLNRCDYGTDKKPDFDPSLLLQISNLISWQNPSARYLFPGWLAMARICGIMKTRPHLWVTGGAGTGKTVVIDDIAHVVLEKGSVHLAGSTTEAALRQKLGYDSVPVLFDEFETNSQKNSDRIESIIELLRVAFSTSGASIARGTVHGQAMSFQAHFCAMVSGIRVNLPTESDRGRFVILELVKTNDTSHWPKLEALIDQLTPEYGQTMFEYMVANATLVHKLVADAFAFVRSRRGAREAQKIAPILGCYFVLCGESEISEHIILDALRIGEEDEEKPESDHEDLLDYLLSTSVDIQYQELGNLDRIHSRKMSIAEALDDRFSDGLERFGMKLTDDGLLFIANDKHSEIKKILRDTKWAVGWTQTLRRIDAAKSSRIRCGGKRWWGTAVPFDD